MNKMLRVLITAFYLNMTACTTNHDSAKDEYEKESENISGLLGYGLRYYLRKGTPPESLEILLNFPFEPHITSTDLSTLKPYDIWGTGLRYERQKDRIRIHSAGKDHIFWTCDDLFGTIELRENTILTIESGGLVTISCFD